MGSELGDNNENIMENRLGRLAGLAAFALMLLRLGRLISSEGDAPAWQLIMIASAFLGGVIWWLLNQTISNRKIATVLFVSAGLILFLRISAPHTLIGGFLPSLETGGVLVQEIGQAIDLIRFGVAPVFPGSGVVAILSIQMWVIGGLYTWGATGGPTTAMVLPSLALYLQFAVMDRVPAGRGWMGAAAVVIALSVAAVAMERRSDAGRVRDLEGRPLPRRAGSMAFILAIVIAGGSVALADRGSSLVPSTGNLQWRVGSGYGYGVGGVSYDRLADLQQQIISRSNTVLFRATLSEEAPPADQIYWRMESLDTFDGVAWRPGNFAAPYYTSGVAGGDPNHAYRGTTQTIAQRVAIEQLRSQVVPIAGIAAVLDSDQINPQSFQIAPDGSVIYQPRLGLGEQFQAATTFALHDEDLGALASSNGVLTPMFAAAAEAGVFSAEPAPLPGDTTRPEDIDRFVALPKDFPATLLGVALERTLGATTDFEKAWLLQYWFRDSGDFTYSTNVSTGQSSLQLEDWLTDPVSTNYRVGYCEQFANGMAVLGRELGIPTRVVWGFTPGVATFVEVIDKDGNVVTDEDGNVVLEEVIEVRENNAHAWVEMWMDGVGWVKFDPTPRGDGALPNSLTADFNPVVYLPPPGDLGGLDRSAEEFAGETNPFAIDQTGNPIGDSSGFAISKWWLVIPALLIIALITPILKSVRRRRRVRRLRDGDITAAWEEIIDRLQDLGSPVPAHQTPMEFATATDRSLVPIARSYSAAIYGGIKVTASQDDLDTVESWLKLRYEGGKRTRAALNPKSLFD